MGDRTHTLWLEFLKKAIDLPAGYSLDDLRWFEEVAKQQFPNLAPLIGACVTLASVSGNVNGSQKSRRQPTKDDTQSTSESATEILTSMMKDVTNFPKNSDLVRFVTDILPQEKAARFDKMSRDEIVKWFVRRYGSIDDRTRFRVVSALKALHQDAGIERTSPSFVTKWQNIIRDMKI